MNTLALLAILADSTTVIRVNQVGYLPDAPKIAVFRNHQGATVGAPEGIRQLVAGRGELARCPAAHALSDVYIRDARALPRKHYVPAVRRPHGRGWMTDVNQLIDRDSGSRMRLSGCVKDGEGRAAGGSCESEEGFHGSASISRAVSSRVPSAELLASNALNSRSNGLKTASMLVAGRYGFW